MDILYKLLYKLAMSLRVRIALIGLLAIGGVASLYTDHATLGSRVAGYAVIGGAIGLVYCNIAQCFRALVRAVNQRSSGDRS